RHTRCSGDWSSDVCSSDLLHLTPHLGRERILLLGLRLEKLLPPLQKLAVVPLHLERTLWIDRIDLHHLRGDVLQKVPVVGDHQEIGRASCRERGWMSAGTG